MHNVYGNGMIKMVSMPCPTCRAIWSVLWLRNDSKERNYYANGKARLPTVLSLYLPWRTVFIATEPDVVPCLSYDGNECWQCLTGLRILLDCLSDIWLMWRTVTSLLIAVDRTAVMVYHVYIERECLYVYEMDSRGAHKAYWSMGHDALSRCLDWYSDTLPSIQVFAKRYSDLTDKSDTKIALDLLH